MDDPDTSPRMPLCRAGVRLGTFLISHAGGSRIRPHLAWAGILVGPATLLVAIGSCFASVLWLRHQWWMAHLFRC